MRIDVLLPHMPPRLRAAMDFVAQALMAAFACTFAWRCWILVIDSWETGIKSSTYLLTPLWVPQAILAVGFSLLAVTAVTMAGVIAAWSLQRSREAARPELAVPVRDAAATSSDSHAA